MYTKCGFPTQCSVFLPHGKRSVFPHPYRATHKIVVHIFYVLLTVRLITVFVNSQLDAQFSTRFEQPSAHHQESPLYQCDLWYMSLYIGDRAVCRFSSI